MANYSNEGGVYLFTHKDSNKFYAGSTIKFFTRFKNHQINSTRLSRGSNSKFYKFVKDSGGWPNFNWTIIKSIPNHGVKFFKLNPFFTLNYTELKILLYFNQFEVRIYEQAVFNHFHPELNTSYSVTFGF